MLDVVSTSPTRLSGGKTSLSQLMQHVFMFLQREFRKYDSNTPMPVPANPTIVSTKLSCFSNQDGLQTMFTHSMGHVDIYVAWYFFWWSHNPANRAKSDFGQPSSAASRVSMEVIRVFRALFVTACANKPCLFFFYTSEGITD